ncbi:MAG: sel1 repeat family protein [Proteobacteria bacterium]|nr:sel1 repeat family protein [Pseudomonadota bacterium]
MRAAIRALLVAFVAVLPVHAQTPEEDATTYEAGLKAYLDGDPATAWFFWIGPAERGHRDAQFSLGHLYRAGEGVPADQALAAQWFTRAAEQGDPQAMLNLALMHEQGAGVTRDLPLAYAYAARAGRLLQGADFERARIAAARVAVGFAPGEADRARRLLIELDRRRPLAPRAP